MQRKHADFDLKHSSASDHSARDSASLGRGIVLDAEDDPSMLVGPGLAIGLTPRTIGIGATHQGLEGIRPHCARGSALQPQTGDLKVLTAIAKSVETSSWCICVIFPFLPIIERQFTSCL